MVLDNLEPRGVFYFFEEISKIPRGSGHEARIGEWIYDLARSKGLWASRDTVHNVLVKKPGTPGYEKAAPLILQGHVDMVCEKNKDTVHNFLTDPIHLKIDGDFIYADGTTLGADNGVAVAMNLALMTAEDVPHPPLELLFTTNEETGMNGAESIEASLLQGRRLINLDSEVEGEFCTSCAGGLKTVVTLPARKQALPDMSAVYALRVKGLKGGHSGMEIDKERANSNHLLGRTLLALSKNLRFSLISVSGGLKINAIPRESEAILGFQRDDYKKAATIVTAQAEMFRREYRASDPAVQLELALALDSQASKAFASDALQKVLALLLLTPIGVQAMSLDLPGLVETSNNLGVVSTEDSAILFSNQIRSSVTSRKYAVRDQLHLLATVVGAKVQTTGDYPEWEYQPQSALRETLLNLFEKKYSRKAKLTATHAGLECGLFAKKWPGVELISFGPDLFDVHTPDEHMSISSVARVWDFLLDALKELG
ncbi:MAG: aminoacyl-histidine dipeptidase [Clostridiales bacterium]|nr:aminoacyl-histidine dipeptidase [Clostridiales bacterium]